MLFLKRKLIYNLLKIDIESCFRFIEIVIEFQLDDYFNYFIFFLLTRLMGCFFFFFLKSKNRKFVGWISVG